MILHENATGMLLIRNLRYVTILGLSEKTPPNALVSKGDLYGLQAMEFCGFNRHLDFLLDWKQCSGRFKPQLALYFWIQIETK